MCITLYTTDCPKCKVLEAKLDDAGIDYKVERDVDKLIAMGVREAPILNIDGVYHNFTMAVKWVNAQKG